MKKKVLILTTVAILALLIPSMITFSPVQAKPKLYFLLHKEGDDRGPAYYDRDWFAGETWHVRGGEFEIKGDFYILIGVTKIQPVDYVCSSDVNLNYKTLRLNVNMEETISIEYMGLEGTIEILVADKLDFLTMTSEGTFVGHGTGDFKGVKVAGETSGYYDPIKGMMIFDREGTVMGWPE